LDQESEAQPERKTMSDRAHLWKPRLTGFPTGRLAAYAYLEGVSLVLADLEATAKLHVWISPDVSHARSTFGETRRLLRRRGRAINQPPPPASVTFGS
jgi:hypothetical protein